MSNVPPSLEKPAPDLQNVAYGPHPRNVIDFWRPRGKGPAPLVLYIHGGGFMGGDKTTIPPTVLVGSLEAGFAVAAINYRLSDSVSFPGFMLDCGRALQVIRNRADEWNVDPGRVASTGGSAGGGISLWLGFHPDLADPASEDPISRQSTRLTCLGVDNTQCSYSPIFFRENGLGPAANHSFMPPFYGLTYKQMDTPEARKLFTEAAPMTWFRTGGPPVFIYYPQGEDPLPPHEPVRTWETGEVDPLSGRAVHHPKMGRIIKKKLDALDVECTLHIGVGDRVTDIQAEMVEFFQRHLLA